MERDEIKHRYNLNRDAEDLAAAKDVTAEERRPR